MNILVINAGSSSLKYQLLNPETGVLLAKGLCERIGIDGKFTYKPQLEGKEAIKAADVAMPTHNEAIAAVLNALVDEKNGVIGYYTLDLLPLTLLGVAGVVCGQRFGLKLGGKLNAVQLRRLVYAYVILSGAVTVVQHL